jgi:hypothetical protein
LVLLNVLRSPPLPGWHRFAGLPQSSATDPSLELRCFVLRAVECSLLMGVLAEPPRLASAQLLEPDIVAGGLDFPHQAPVAITLVPVDSDGLPEGPLR